MRFATFAVVFSSLPALAFAQAQPCTPNRYAFDPYKPSDLAVVRQVGAGLLAHAPVTSLLRLDPYVPTEAQMLREYGGALPLWPYAWSPMYVPPAYPVVFGRVCESATQAITTSAEPPMTTFAELTAALERARESLGVAAGEIRPRGSAAAPTVVDRNTGVSIDYAGRTWVSAGRAVLFRAGEFVRVGELDGSPVFRFRDTSENLIYVPTSTGLVAPFRATPNSRDGLARPH